jgi:DNA-binding CsgD family transcriptional regulator/tetratricopeptide (TPR) repeat protein
MKLLDRTSQIQALSSALSQVRAREGQGQIALVYGEAGIGKTSLVEHFINENKKSWRILQGACDSLFTPRPLGPLYDITLQTQGQLLSLLDHESKRTAIFTACLHELQKQATILVIEDIHWADEATLDLLKYLGRRIRQTASLMVLTYRDDELTVDHPLRLLLGDLASSPFLHHISVAPLSEGAVRELVENGNVDPVALYRLTNGNPFFVTEILAVGGGTPPTVRDAVLARAARLSAAARSVLEVAAVIGSRVEAWLLPELARVESAKIDECLAGGMLQNHGEYYTFRHELERQTVLESISPQRKMVLHRMALEALKQSPKTDHDLARLAEQAEGAMDANAVIKFAPAAARQASAASAHREAAAQYTRALRYADVLPQAEHAQLLEKQSYELWLNGQLEDAVKAQQAALTLWRQLDRQDRESNCLRFLAQLTMFAGDLIAAKSYVMEALELREKLPPDAELASVYATKARVHMVFGEDEQAVHWGTRAIEMAEAQGAMEVLVAALNTVGNIEQNDQPEIGQAKLKRSLELAREHNLHEHVARAYGNLGDGEYYLRRYDNALDYDAKAIENAEKHNLDVFLYYTKRGRAKVYFEQGRWREAVAEANEVLHSNHIFPLTRAEMLVVLTDIDIRQGELVSSETLGWLREFANEYAALDEHSIPMLFAEMAWLEGDLMKCCAEIESKYEIVRQLNFSRQTGELAYWMWRAGAITTAPDNAGEPYATQIAGHWKKAAAMWEKLGCPYEQAMALMDGDEAAQRAALEIFTRLGAQPIIKILKQKMREQGIRIPRRHRTAAAENPFHLTGREKEALGYLVQGLSNDAIARRLNLSIRTVEHHIASILRKMGVHSRAEAVVLASKVGFISCS